MGGNEIHLRIKKIISELPDDIPSLFIRMFTRLEEEFGHEFVKGLVSSVAVSNEGMLRSELSAILRLPVLTSNRLYSHLNEYLFERGDLINFFHQQVEEAVKKQYSSYFNAI